MEEKNKGYRIGWGMIVILLGLASIADLTTLIPIVGDFVGPVFWLGMSWYLWKTGHGLLKPKTFIPEIISLIAEFIPVVQELPTIIAATLAIIIVSRLEDKTGISLLAPISRGQKVRLPSKPPPLNQGGVRQPQKE